MKKRPCFIFGEQWNVPLGLPLNELIISKSHALRRRARYDMASSHINPGVYRFRYWNLRASLLNLKFYKSEEAVRDQDFEKDVHLREALWIRYFQHQILYRLAKIKLTYEQIGLCCWQMRGVHQLKSCLTYNLKL